MCILNEWAHSPTYKDSANFCKKVYRRCICSYDRYAAEAIGHMELEDICPEDIRDIFIRMDGKHPPGTFQVLRHALLSMMNEAQKAGYINKNPVTRTTCFPPYTIYPEVIRCR